MTYDETSIKVLRGNQLIDKFPWVEIEALAHEYSVPVQCVRRGFEACLILNISPEEYVDRYLRKIELPKHLELIEVYTELMRKNNEQLNN